MSGRISVYNLADLKNTSDDAIPNYLNSLKFTQSHTLTDTRLAIGYSAFTVSAVCFLWDYKLGFERTKLYTTVAVALYVILNVALTGWVVFREKSIIYEGTTPFGEKISVSTNTKKNEPVYNVTVKTTAPGSKTIETKFSRPFEEWFNAHGNFIAKPFQQILATSAPAIGKFDAKNCRTDSHVMAEMSPEVLDALLASDATAGATTLATEKKKKGRNRNA